MESHYLLNTVEQSNGEVRERSLLLLGGRRDDLVEVVVHHRRPQAQILHQVAPRILADKVAQGQQIEGVVLQPVSTHLRAYVRHVYSISQERSGSRLLVGDLCRQGFRRQIRRCTKSNSRKDPCSKSLPLVTAGTGNGPVSHSPFPSSACDDPMPSCWSREAMAMLTEALLETCTG